MSVTNKLFSLLGFAEPIPLKRSNDNNILPEKIVLLSTNNQVEPNIKQVIAQLATDLKESIDGCAESSIEALVIDATNYEDDNCYQHLYSTVQSALKYIAPNARVIVMASTMTTALSIEHNTFSRALIGFSKSLAKEIGRKGCTANVIFINKADDENKEYNADALSSPIRFFLSVNSAFVSGQVLTLNKMRKPDTPRRTHDNSKLVAIVTGAAQGIGKAIAHKLASDNYYVIGVDIEPMNEQLTLTMNKLHGEALILDISTKEANAKIVEIASKHGGVDLIVHNAGITRDKTLAKMPQHFWQQTIDINLLAVMRINKALIANASINKNGRIVCLSSMNGIAGQRGQTNYACSKAGIIGYVESMSDDLAVKNICINAVAPGFIETKMTEQVPFFTREIGRRINALGQGGLPEDVAHTIAFLGNESSYAISGQTIRVCGLNIIGA
jgi:3-oxoacyl-[acyl-carrier protein] reductase